MTTRRNFLLGGFGAMIGGVAHAYQPATRFHEIFAAQGVNSRVLWLHRPQSNESIQVVYAENGILLRDGYLAACNLLRDVKANEVHAIDPGILEVLGAINTWTQLHGYDRPITILSGYRNKNTNGQIEGAAKGSLHTQGRAADFRLPGISASDVVRLTKDLSDGGVGVYANRNFIHVDTGRSRTWRGA